MNKIGTYILIGALGVSTLGCNAYRGYDEIQKDVPELNGLDMIIQYMPVDKIQTNKILRIGTYSDSTQSFEGTLDNKYGFIVARDDNGDNRIDRMNISGPKGDKIEKFANIQFLDSILTENSARIDSIIETHYEDKE